MPRVMNCPFFGYYNGKRITCEAGTLDFLSRKAWDEYTRDYCCHAKLWKNCTLAQNLLSEYERRDDG